ncbi:MAG TPA: SRPBCC domain-containing protein [Streptomyces sp.]|nr:SRPBCC domain-containing protein [Streptomyces sp.]
MTPSTGLTKDAGWQIGVSRTLPLPGLTLADGTTGEVRGYREGSRIRLTHRPAGAQTETTVQFTVTPRGGACLLRFHQERLAGSAEREEQRRHWQGVMDEVAAALSPPVV